MKKAYRQLALFIAIVIFFALGPLLVLYAMGYRFQLGNTETLPVGVVLIETNPRRAQVFIDGLLLGQTPRSITNLEPGEYQIKVTIPDYEDWQKNIVVDPTSVTELRTIRLFPKKPELKTLQGNVQTFTLSPNRNLIATITTTNELHIIDTQGEQIVPAISLTRPAQQLLWSPDSTSILLRADTQISIIDITKQVAAPRLIPALNQARDIAWDQRVPGRLFYRSAANELRAYHVNTGSGETIATQSTTFAISSRHILTADDSNTINVLSLQGALIDRLAVPVEKDIDKLYVTPAGEIAILFTDQSLALVNEEKKLSPIANQVKRVGWSPNGQLLFVQTDETAVHVYNVADEGQRHLPLEKLFLVARQSRPMREIQWFAGGNHLVYQVDDEIHLIEIDTRDHPIDYRVDTTNLGTSNATVGAHGETMLYLKNTGAGTRLVSANLQIEK